MLGVFVVACLPILRCVGMGQGFPISYVIDPQPGQTGVVKQDNGKPIGKSHAGQIPAGKSDSKLPAETHVGASSAENLNSVGVSSPETLDNAKAAEHVSTAESSSVQVKADASKVHRTEHSTAVSSSAEFNVDASNPASFKHGRPHMIDTPHVVDRIPHARSDHANHDGSSMFQFVFLGCAMCAMIVWLYLYEFKNHGWSYLAKQPRTWQQDADWQKQFEKKFKNPNSTAMRMHTMLKPTVEDAKDAISFVAAANSSYQKKADLFKQDVDDLLTFEFERIKTSH